MYTGERMQGDTQSSNLRYIDVFFAIVPYYDRRPITSPIHSLKQVAELLFCPTLNQLTNKIKKPALHAVCPREG
jgi:hypothetical protein